VSTNARVSPSRATASRPPRLPRRRPYATACRSPYAFAAPRCLTAAACVSCPLPLPWCVPVIPPRRKPFRAPRSKSSSWSPDAARVNGKAQDRSDQRDGGCRTSRFTGPARSNWPKPDRFGARAPVQPLVRRRCHRRCLPFKKMPPSVDPYYGLDDTERGPPTQLPGGLRDVWRLARRHKVWARGSGSLEHVPKTAAG
jgi:hypothetical protein